MQHAQLGHLSTFASAIFKDLAADSDELTTRLATAGERTAALVEQLPRVGAHVSKMSVEQLLSFDSITVERNTTNDMANSNATRFRLTADTLPAALKERLDDPAVSDRQTDSRQTDKTTPVTYSPSVTNPAPAPAPPPPPPPPFKRTNERTNERQQGHATPAGLLRRGRIVAAGAAAGERGKFKRELLAARLA